MFNKGFQNMKIIFLGTKFQEPFPKGFILQLMLTYLVKICEVMNFKAHCGKVTSKKFKWVIPIHVANTFPIVHNNLNKLMLNFWMNFYNNIFNVRASTIGWYH